MKTAINTNRPNGILNRPLDFFSSEDTFRQHIDFLKGFLLSEDDSGLALAVQELLETTTVPEHCLLRDLLDHWGERDPEVRFGIKAGTWPGQAHKKGSQAAPVADETLPPDSSQE